MENNISLNFQSLQDIDTAWEESDSTGYARIVDALTQLLEFLHFQQLVFG